MPIQRKRIEVAFKLGQGTFPGGNDTVKLSGLRTSAHVQVAGTTASTLQLRINGMTLDNMNRLSMMGIRFATGNVQYNTVTVDAGNENEALTTVFQGTVMMAYVDFQNQPDVAFVVLAQAGGADAVINTEPTSFGQGGSVANIMSGFATRMNLSFENNGVEITLPPSYFSGNLTDQVRQAAKAANIEWIVENGTLAIWPKGGSRGGDIPDVSPETGMVGYPTYTEFGIMLRTAFNPSIGFGGKIKVTSQLKPACGEWIVYALEHVLESELPRGQWFSTMQCVSVDNPLPIIAPVSP